MKKLGTIIGAAGFVAAVGFAGTALATHVGAPSKYADTVIDH